MIFIRSVSTRGAIFLLGQKFKVGRRDKYTCATAILDTHRQRLTVYLAGKVLKHWHYKLSRH